MLDCIEPIVQEETDAYVEKELEYNSGNQAAALSGSHFKNSGVIWRSGQLAPVGWRQAVGGPEPGQV